MPPSTLEVQELQRVSTKYLNYIKYRWYNKRINTQKYDGEDMFDTSPDVGGEGKLENGGGDNGGEDNDEEKVNTYHIYITLQWRATLQLEILNGIWLLLL